MSSLTKQVRRRMYELLKDPGFTDLDEGTLSRTLTLVKAALKSVDPSLNRAFFQMCTIRDYPALEYLMGVRYARDSKSLPYIELAYNQKMIAALVRACQDIIGPLPLSSLPETLTNTICVAVEHEIWHVMLGDIFGDIDRYHTDQMWQLAVEIRINDGHIGSSRANNIVLEIVTLDALGIRDKAEEIAEQLGYSRNWIRDADKVYEVLKKIFTVVTISSCGDGSGDIEVTVTDTEGKTTTYRFSAPQPMESEGSDGDKEGEQDAKTSILRRMSQAMDGDNRFRYNPYENKIEYNPNGFSEAERRITSEAVVVDWARIRNLLGYRDSVGYDRRTAPACRAMGIKPSLVTREPHKKKVTAFIDSSGSIWDELLSAFLNCVRMAPNPVEVYYFSTVVTNHPHTGGTRIACVNEFVEKMDRYPDVILVLTDGEDMDGGSGKLFEPRHPNRWYWVLQDNHGEVSPEIRRRIEQTGGTIMRATRRKASH